MSIGVLVNTHRFRKIKPFLCDVDMFASACAIIGGDVHFEQNVFVVLADQCSYACPLCFGLATLFCGHATLLVKPKSAYHIATNILTYAPLVPRGESKRVVTVNIAAWPQ